MKTTHKGSCHCGAIRFECELDLAASGTSRCNCSFCHKARFWMTLVPIADFRLLEGESHLADYQRTPPNMTEPFLHLHFCRRCGVRPFTRGGVLPSLGGEFYAVNVACLDDLSDDDLVAAKINYIDGRNDAFGRSPAETRYL